MGEKLLQLIRDKNTLLYCIKKLLTPDHIGHKAIFKNKDSNINHNVTRKLTN